MELEASLLWILGGALFPLWLAAGLADYLCHRATNIEGTSGVPEALAHLILGSLMGFGAMLILFLELNALTWTLLAALFVAHEVVTYYDLRWAVPRREIGPVEQIIHAFLECVPFAAVVSVGLVVLATGKTEFALALKSTPVSPALTAAVLVSLTLFGAIPFWEEAWRCWRHPTPRSAVRA